MNVWKMKLKTQSTRNFAGDTIEERMEWIRLQVERQRKVLALRTSMGNKWVLYIEPDTQQNDEESANAV